MVSPDLLRKLYVKKSLKNVEGGFEFMLSNPLSDATIIKPGKITLGDEKFKDFTVFIGDKELNNSDISKTNPFSFAVKAEVTLRIPRGTPLPVEKHAIKLDFLTEEYGELKFKVKDRIRE